MLKLLKYCGIAYISIGAALGAILYASYVFAYLAYVPGWSSLGLGATLEFAAVIRAVSWGPSLIGWARHPLGYSFGKWLAPGFYASTEAVRQTRWAKPPVFEVKASEVKRCFGDKADKYFILSIANDIIIMCPGVMNTDQQMRTLAEVSTLYNLDDRTCTAVASSLSRPYAQRIHSAYKSDGEKKFCAWAKSMMQQQNNDLFTRFGR